MTRLLASALGLGCALLVALALVTGPATPTAAQAPIV